MRLFSAPEVGSNRWWWEIIIALILSLIVLSHAGCASGVRLTDDQAKEIAQAKADLAAARDMVRFAEALGEAGAVIRDKLYLAAAHRFDAGTANVELPAPEKPAAALVTASGPNEALIEQESQDAKASAGNPPPSPWGMALGIAGGVGLAALSVLRFSPGLFGAAANIAHTFLAPKATREMREAEQKAHAVAQQAVAYGHAVTQMAKDAGMGDTVRQVQDKFAKAQDALGIREQIDAILAAHKTTKPPSAG